MHVGLSSTLGGIYVFTTLSVMWSNSEMMFLLSFFRCTSSSESIEDHPYNRHNFPGEEIAVGGGGGEEGLNCIVHYIFNKRTVTRAFISLPPQPACKGPSAAVF